MTDYTVTRWDWRAETHAPQPWTPRCALERCFAHDGEGCAAGSMSRDDCANWPRPRLVVCEPSLCDACAGTGVEASAKSCSWCRACAGISRLSVEAHKHVVVGGEIGEIYVADYREFVHWPSWVIPALYARTQADLEGRRCAACYGAGDVRDPSGGRADCDDCGGSGTLGGLRALLDAQAERRALVCSPREALDLRVDLESTSPLGLLACPSCNGCGGGETGSVDVNGYPAERVCPRCKGERTLIDLLIIMGEVGPDARPLHPDHVRSLVEQARAAGVPVVFAGWGEWVPQSQCPPTTDTLKEQRAVGCTKFIGDEPFFCVGADRAGALLDGAEVHDPIQWLRGAA